MADDLELTNEELPDDDPDIIAGMERLRLLRQHEDDAPVMPSWGAPRHTQKP